MNTPPKLPQNPALAAAMARTGHTAKSLAARVGICPQTLYAISRGRLCTTPRTAQRIADALDTTVDKLDLTLNVRHWRANNP